MFGEVSIEAGLGFDGAMARLVQRSSGPVVDQFARVLQDVRLGLARDDALQALAQRTNSADLRTFANAMAQAGRHGLPMAGVLRAQAAEVRANPRSRSALLRAAERTNEPPWPLEDAA